MEPKAGHWESISAGQKMLTLTMERVMKGGGRGGKEEEGGERGKGRNKKERKGKGEEGKGRRL